VNTAESFVVLIRSELIMSAQRQLAAPAYFVALALMLIPPLDTVTQVLPVRLGDVRWRFGLFGLVSNSLLLPLTGLLIAFLVTVVFEHRRTQRALGIVSLLALIALVGGLGVFGLDTLRFAGALNQRTRIPFRVAIVIAMIKSLIGVLTLAGFAWASFKPPRGSRSRSNRGGPSLIIGTQPTVVTPRSTRAITDDPAISETQPR
jgi:hypothetical protein